MVASRQRLVATIERASGSWWPWAILTLVVALTAGVRWRLLDVPLERDEGEYAYAAQLMLDGIPPYRLAYNMKFPGTYAAYAAALALFGESVRGVHLGLLVANALAIVLTFLVGRRLAGDLAAVLAAATYAMLSISPSVLGTAAHATHFVVVPALAGLLLLLGPRARGGRAVLWAGVLFGLAILAKQHGVFYLAFAAGLVGRPALFEPGAARRRAILDVGRLLLGAALPVVVTLGLLAAAGVLDRFVFWTIRYAAEYVVKDPWRSGWSRLVPATAKIASAAPLVWIAAAISFLAAGAPRARWPHSRLLATFAVFSFLSVCPGLYFREHYFVTLLPGVALLAATGAAWAQSMLSRSGRGRFALLPVAFLIIGLAHAVWIHRAPFFEWTPHELSRAVYGRNPFPESEDVARYLRRHVPEGERIAVLGSEPQIYFLSDRRSATGYIYTYGLVENQPFAERMQREMIAEIEAADPSYVVFVGVRWSWIPSRNAPTRMFEWASALVARRYDTVGLVEIADDHPSRFFWDRAASRSPSTPDFILVLRRRGGPGESDPGRATDLRDP